MAHGLLVLTASFKPTTVPHLNWLPHHCAIWATITPFHILHAKKGEILLVILTEPIPSNVAADFDCINSKWYPSFKAGRPKQILLFA